MRHHTGYRYWQSRQIVCIKQLRSNLGGEVYITRQYTLYSLNAGLLGKELYSLYNYATYTLYSLNAGLLGKKLYMRLFVSPDQDYNNSSVKLIMLSYFFR